MSYLIKTMKKKIIKAWRWGLSYGDKVEDEEEE